MICSEITILKQGTHSVSSTSSALSVRILISAIAGSSSGLAVGVQVIARTDNPNLVFMRSTEEILVRATSIAALSTKGVIHHV